MLTRLLRRSLSGERLVHRNQDANIEALWHTTQMCVTEAERTGAPLRRGDVVVITQKIISKAEGRLIPLSDPRALDLHKREGDAMTDTPTLTGRILAAIAENPGITATEFS